MKTFLIVLLVLVAFVSVGWAYYVPVAAAPPLPDSEYAPATCTPALAPACGPGCPSCPSATTIYAPTPQAYLPRGGAVYYAGPDVVAVTVTPEGKVIEWVKSHPIRSFFKRIFTNCQERRANRVAARQVRRGY